MDAAVRPCKECPNIGPFVIGGIVPDDMDQSFVRVARFNFGEQLRSTHPIDGGWFDKRRVEGFKIERFMDIHAASPCSGWDCGI